MNIRSEVPIVVLHIVALPAVVNGSNVPRKHASEQEQATSIEQTKATTRRQALKHAKHIPWIMLLVERCQNHHIHWKWMHMRDDLGKRVCVCTTTIVTRPHLLLCRRRHQQYTPLLPQEVGLKVLNNALVSTPQSHLLYKTPNDGHPNLSFCCRRSARTERHGMRSIQNATTKTTVRTCQVPRRASASMLRSSRHAVASKLLKGAANLSSRCAVVTSSLAMRPLRHQFLSIQS